MQKPQLGTYREAKGNFGFVSNENGDFFVHWSKSMGALSGDSVLFLPVKSRFAGREYEARILKIEKRSDEPKFGILTYSGKMAMVKLAPPNEQSFLLHKEKHQTFPKAGTYIAVKIIGFGRRTSAIFEHSIVDGNDPLAEEKLLIAMSGVPTVFPEKVEYEANHLKHPSITWRADFRWRTIITIDGEDAKDLDDAIEVEKTPSGYRLFVHIADASEYVRDGSELDHEALRRGTSIYLANSVIPMLPKSLSNGACSLHPGEPKFCLSLTLDINKSGQVVGKKLEESVIESAYRATYTEVEADKKGEATELPENVRTMLKNAWELKHILDKRRNFEGKIRFPSHETKLIMDGDTVKDIVAVKHLESHALIEEFMVIANEEIAKIASKMKLPFLYRVHDAPSLEWLDRLKAVCETYKVPFVPNPSITSKEVAKLVESISLLDPNGVSTKSLLSAMCKALYSEKRSKHFGLALEYYSHFTSPIRRYPDLQIHRLLKEQMHGHIEKKQYPKLEKKLHERAKTLSWLERRAERLEYDYRDLKICRFLENRKWEQFRWTVTTVMENGAFIQILPGVDGFLPKSSQTQRYILKLGMELDVKVKYVDVRFRRIELEIS